MMYTPHRRLFPILLAVAAAAALGALLGPIHPSQAQNNRQPGESEKMLGEADVRFGIPIEEGGGAIVARWKDFQAYFVSDQGAVSELDFKLKHQFAGQSIPPGGIVVVQDIQGIYHAVNSVGRVATIEIPR